MTTIITANPKKTYALIVGIEKYNAGGILIRDVKGPVDDALWFAKWLEKRGVPTKNIQLFLSPLEEKVSDFKSNVAAAKLCEILDFITEKLSKQTGDLLFLFWEGHGFITGARVAEERLITADATTEDWRNLNLSSLLDYLFSSRFSIKTQICLIESCRVDLPEGAREGTCVDFPIGTLGKNKDNNYIEQFVLFAASKGQFATASRFSEKIKVEFEKLDNDSPWPPDMLSVSDRVKKSFSGISEHQKPIYSWSKSWDGDKKVLCHPVDRKPTICICKSNKNSENITKLLKKYLRNSCPGTKILDLNCYEWESNEDWQKELESIVILLCLITEDFIKQKFIVEDKSDHMIRVEELRPLYDSGKNIVIPIFIENPNKSDDDKNLKEWLSTLPLACLSTELPSHLNKNSTSEEITQIIKAIVNEINKNLEDWNSSTYDNRAKVSEDDKSISLDLQYLNTVIGRKNVFEELDNYLNFPANPDNASIVVLHGWPGIGKNSILKAWLAHLELKNYLSANRIFTWSFQPQIFGKQPNLELEEDNIASAEELINRAFAFFTGENDNRNDIGHLHQAYKLVEKVRGEKAKSKYKSSLLVIYGLDELQESEGLNKGQVYDKSLEILIEGLAKDDNTLCIIASRIRLTLPKGLKHKLVHIDLDRENYKIPLEDWKSKYTERKISEDQWKSIYERFNSTYSLNLILSLITKNEISPEKFSLPLEVDKNIADEKNFANEMDIILEILEDKYKDDVGHLLIILKMLAVFRGRVKWNDLKALMRYENKEPKELNGCKNFDIEAKKAISKLSQLGLLCGISFKNGELSEADDNFQIEIHPLISNYFKASLENDKEGHYTLYKRYSNLYNHFKSQQEQDNTQQEQDNTMKFAKILSLYDGVYYGYMSTKYATSENLKRYEDNENKFAPSLNELWVYFWEKIRGKYDHKPGNDLGCWNTDLAALDFFFDGRWDQPNHLLSRMNQAHLLNEAGFDLRSLAQLEAATIPLQKALRIVLSSDEQSKKEKYVLAALSSGNLAKTYLALGKIYDALEYAHRSVYYADQSSEDSNSNEVAQVNWRIETRVWLGEVLTMAGRFWESEAAFNKAKEISRDVLKKHYLQHQSHYRYCRLLLDQARCVAKDWVQHSNITISPITCDIENCDCNISNCCKSSDPVWMRYCQIEELTNHVSNERDETKSERQYHLFKGLYQLTTGWSLLLKCEYLKRLEETNKKIECNKLLEDANKPWEKILSDAEQAMRRAWEDLEAVDHQIYMTECLLGLAAVFRNQGRYQKIAYKFDEAEAQLAIVLEIATRGNMKLFEADYHLEQAYLSWDKYLTFPELGLRRKALLNLTDAESIIQDTGYGRRLYDVLALRSNITSTFTDIP